VSIRIADLPDVAAAAGLRLRDELLAVLGGDLVSAWLHGGTTFADRPTRAGDLDFCAVIANVEPDERNPRIWRRDPASRPNRIHAVQEAIAGDLGVELDTLYLLADEVGFGRLPTSAFDESRRETGWAVYRAHWLAGQYVVLHGPAPDELVVAPTTAALRRALDRELEHLERHVYEGDANDPDEATYAILNGCRILHTLAIDSPVISKHAAGIWGLENLPEHWHDVINAAIRSYDGGASPVDAETLRVTMAPFVAMVGERLPGSRSRPAGPPRWS